MADNSAIPAGAENLPSGSYYRNAAGQLVIVARPRDAERAAPATAAVDPFTGGPDWITALQADSAQRDLSDIIAGLAPSRSQSRNRYFMIALAVALGAILFTSKPKRGRA